MPDMERMFRQMEIDLAENDMKLAVAAYHAGLDRARKEVVVIFVVATLMFTVLRLWG